MGMMGKLDDYTDIYRHTLHITPPVPASAPAPIPDPAPATTSTPGTQLSRAAGKTAGKVKTKSRK